MFFIPKSLVLHKVQYSFVSCFFSPLFIAILIFIYSACRCGTASAQSSQKWHTIDFILVRVVPRRPVDQGWHLLRLLTSSAVDPSSHLLCKVSFTASICHTHAPIQACLTHSVAIFKPAVSSTAIFVPEEAHIILTNPAFLSLSDLKVCIPAKCAYSSSLWEAIRMSALPFLQAQWNDILTSHRTQPVTWKIVSCSWNTLSLPEKSLQVSWPWSFSCHVQKITFFSNGSFWVLVVLWLFSQLPFKSKN